MFVELKQLVVHLGTLFQNVPSLSSMWAFGEKKSQPEVGMDRMKLAASLLLHQEESL